MSKLLLSNFKPISKQSLEMGSYCHVCDQFVNNVDVCCSEEEYHRDDPYYDYERYPMRDFSGWYRYEPPTHEPDQTLNEKLSSDAIWYQREIRTRSKSEKHRTDIIIDEVRRLLDTIDVAYETLEKVRIFENIILIFKDNKWIFKNKKLFDIVMHKIDTFSEYSSDFSHLKSFKYQLFGMC